MKIRAKNLHVNFLLFLLDFFLSLLFYAQTRSRRTTGPLDQSSIYVDRQRCRDRRLSGSESIYCKCVKYVRCSSVLSRNFSPEFYLLNGVTNLYTLRYKSAQRFPISKISRCCSRTIVLFVQVFHRYRSSIDRCCACVERLRAFEPASKVSIEFHCSK